MSYPTASSSREKYWDPAYDLNIPFKRLPHFKFYNPVEIWGQMQLFWGTYHVVHLVSFPSDLYILLGEKGSCLQTLYVSNWQHKTIRTNNIPFFKTIPTFLSCSFLRPIPITDNCLFIFTFRFTCSLYILEVCNWIVRKLDSTNLHV